MSEQKEKVGAVELPPLRPAHRHTVQIKLVAGGESADDAEWATLDIQSDAPDARAALMAYLRDLFEDADKISESKDGVFQVSDEMGPGVTFDRYYRVS